jgi:peptidoglycan hydrolase CwlO-like protein
MSHEENLSNLHQHLDDLEKRLARKEAEIGKTGSVPSHHRESINEISAQASAMRKKILSAEQSTWDIMKRDLEVDWNILTHSFERWVQHVDEEYRHREP